MTKPKAKTAKATVIIPDGFTSIGKLPALQKQSGISSVSPLVLLRGVDEATYTGFIQRYDVMVNAPHVKAKKGDIVCFDKYGLVIPGVVAWKLKDN